MGQSISTVHSVGAAGSPDAATLQRAHEAMLADKTLQFTLPGIPPPKPPPGWLKGLAEFFDFVGPIMPYLFWGLLGLGIIVIVYFVARELFGLELGWKKKAGARAAAVDWRPDREKARILLEDADALAAQGRYDEAVHMLLLRGVADITARRPRLIGPALTSRDIASLPELPSKARPAFGLIADIVERSFFGGRPVTEPGWREARDAYEQLIFAGSWS
jgi:hypothetical protein